MLKRNYIGFEIVKEYYEFARKRLEEGLYRIKDEKSGVQSTLIKRTSEMLMEVQEEQRFLLT